MSFWKIAWRNIQQRALASSLTGLSMALGVALLVAVIVIHTGTVERFSQDALGYHLIVGGKGGAMQLVLSTVYHLDTPPYPIPYSYYKKFVDGEFAPLTEVAVPYCLGDSYVAPNGKLFRIVATTPDLFDKIAYGNEPDGTPKRYSFQSGGRNFKTEDYFEAVVGSTVAAEAGLKVGDKIEPTHGLAGEGHAHDQFTVVGILEPTGTANDKAVFINIEGFFLLEGHALPGDEDHASEGTAADEHEHESAASHEEDAADDHDHAAEDDEHAHNEEEDAHGDHEHDHVHEHDEPLPESQREVTAILVRCTLGGQSRLTMDINKGEDRIAQAVSPVQQVTKLFNQFVDPLQMVLLVLTVIIVVVASISILVSIYNSMSQRSHDIAVMRALGASRWAVMMIILWESILVALCGGLAGIVLGHLFVGLVSPYVEAHTGVALNPLVFAREELILIPALVVLAALVGLLPAVTAYRTDVAKSLANGQ